MTYSSPNSTGFLTFTPVADASGTATITVTVNDSQGVNNTVGFAQLSVLFCPSENKKFAPSQPWGTLNYMGNLGGPGTFGLYTGTIVCPYFYYYP